ncbi:MAG: twin-arginine translocation signal domain-containing protein [Desulfovibrionaceae bacterium]|nr:twin-arginine translocation signal domain-containing protein [Desulfovibrionaceae bacterium]
MIICWLEKFFKETILNRREFLKGTAFTCGALTTSGVKA